MKELIPDNEKCSVCPQKADTQCNIDGLLFCPKCAVGHLTQHLEHAFSV